MESTIYPLVVPLSGMAGHMTKSADILVPTFRNRLKTLLVNTDAWHSSLVRIWAVSVSNSIITFLIVTVLFLKLHCVVCYILL